MKAPQDEQPTNGVSGDVTEVDFRKEPIIVYFGSGSYFAIQFLEAIDKLIPDDNSK